MQHVNSGEDYARRRLHRRSRWYSTVTKNRRPLQLSAGTPTRSSFDTPRPRRSQPNRGELENPLVPVLTSVNDFSAPCPCRSASQLAALKRVIARLSPSSLFWCSHAETFNSRARGERFGVFFAWKACAAAAQKAAACCSAAYEHSADAFEPVIAHELVHDVPHRIQRVGRPVHGYQDFAHACASL